MPRPDIAIVLVGAKGDANIGATARAMKNFGLSDLRLVRCVPHRTETAAMWAVDARDVLDRARRFSSLDEALADRDAAAAFTRRLGKRRKLRMDVAELPAWLGRRTRAALVFGREDKGLSNEEVRRCDAIIAIPTADALPSLNLAQSVVIACHELFRLGARALPREEFVPRREVKVLLSRLKETLLALGYDDRPPARLRSRILSRLEHLFGRAGLTPRDVRMIEGLLSRIQR